MGIFGLGKKQENTQQKKQVKVFIVEDSQVYAEQLVFFLSSTFEGEIVVSRFPVAEVMEVKLEHKEIPDVIIMDHFLNDKYSDAESGLDALERIKTAYPGIRLVLHTGKNNLHSVEKAVQNGVCYFVPKGENAFEELTKIIRSAIEN